MHDAETLEGIRQKYVALSPVMDERMRRQWAASEASTLGWGGVTVVAEATGLAWNTIKTGMRELRHRAAHPDEPVTIAHSPVPSVKNQMAGICQALVQ